MFDIDESLLEEYAGERSYYRGVGYYAQGLVADLSLSDDKTTATVFGTHPYKVVLRQQGDNFDGDCSCPYGQEGHFCKHCVAVGLAVIRGGVAKVSSPTAVDSDVSWGDIQEYLKGLSKQGLIDMIIDTADDNPKLKHKLQMNTLRATADKLNTIPFYNAIDAALEIEEHFDEYYDEESYFHNAEKTVDIIKDVMDSGFYSEAIDLAEYTLLKIEELLGLLDYIDDDLTYIQDEINDLHLQACRSGKIDPINLADRLFHREVRDSHGSYYSLLEPYADVLGKKGIEHYRKLTEDELKKASSIEGQAEKDHYLNYRGRTLQSIQEALAKLDGDTETLVKLKVRNVASIHDYNEIIQVYRGANQDDKAVEWALKGVDAFPGEVDQELYVFLAEHYERNRQYDEALKLRWRMFADSPHLDRYRNLIETAEKNRSQKEFRQKALDLLFNRLEKDKDPRPHPYSYYYWSSPANVLVEIFIHEGDLHGALREAKIYGCSDEIWLKLAEALKKDHPDDAIYIYQDQIEKTIDIKKNKAYEKAISLLKKLETVYSIHGRNSAFREYLSDLAKQHYRKTSFVKLLTKYRKKIG